MKVSTIFLLLISSICEHAVGQMDIKQDLISKVKKYYQDREIGSYRVLSKFKSSISEDTTISEYICSYKKSGDKCIYRIMYTGDSVQLIFDGDSYYSIFPFYKKYIKDAPSKSSHLSYKRHVEDLPPCNLSELINKLNKSHVEVKDQIYIANLGNTFYQFDRLDGHLKKITEILFSKDGIQFKEVGISYIFDKSIPVIEKDQINDFLKEYSKAGNNEIFIKPKISKDDIGKKFPLFNIKSVLGVEYTNSSVSGKFVLIDLFYESCMPCIQSIPYLNALTNNYPNLIVIGIDPVLRDTLNMSRFIKRYDIKYDIIVGNYARDFWNLIQITGYPTTYLIDPNGNLSLLHNGFSRKFFKAVQTKTGN
jgi:thiol-disulfide isomerase/thioredoxin